MDEPTDAPSDEPVHDTAELDPLRTEPTPGGTTPPDVPPQPPTPPAPGARQGGPDLAPWVDDPGGAGVDEPPTRDLPFGEPGPDRGEPELYQRTVDEPGASDRPVDGTAPPERPAETPPTQDRPAAGTPPSDEQPTDAPPPQDGAIDDAPPWDLEVDEPADDRAPEATDDVDQDDDQHDDDQVDDDDASASSSDVSEFLRELSRLALDGDEAQKPRPGATPPRRPQREDDKPKKRGIFGWGG